MGQIAYRSGYKYQLAKDYSLAIPITPDTDIDTEYLHLSVDGTLTIRAGYAWDGASGPVFNTKRFMRGSLVHDALYQLMQQQHLDSVQYREVADRLMYVLCREDGMSRLFARAVYWTLRRMGARAAHKDREKLVCKAPVRLRRPSRYSVRVLK